MRNLALGGLLVFTSAAAIAYVYTKPAEQPASARIEEAARTPDVCPEESGCPSCQSNVVDVVDLNTAYQSASPVPGVSFDEPPLAKPRPQSIIPARFEQPDLELAPSPRDAAEVAPAPRLVK